MYTFTNKMPKEGQFIMLWEYGTGVWADAYRRLNDGTLQVYNNEYDEWESIDEEDAIGASKKNIKYIIAGDD